MPHSYTLIHLDNVVLFHTCTELLYIILSSQKYVQRIFSNHRRRPRKLISLKPNPYFILKQNNKIIYRSSSLPFQKNPHWKSFKIPIQNFKSVDEKVAILVYDQGLCKGRVDNEAFLGGCDFVPRIMSNQLSHNESNFNNHHKFVELIIRRRTSVKNGRRLIETGKLNCRCFVNSVANGNEVDTEIPPPAYSTPTESVSVTSYSTTEL